MVRNHEVVAAKPKQNHAKPIILIRTGTENGSILPAIKWYDMKVTV
jgi:hypothetical protein